MITPSPAPSSCGRLWQAAGLLALLLLPLFLAVGCATPHPTVSSAKDSTIILREGDVLEVAFPNSTNLDTLQTIRRDGKITLPLVGEVYAIEVTPVELQDKLIKLYEPQISTKEITVNVKASSYPVFVTGSVVRPGKIQAEQPLTAVEAIMEAGGPDFIRANLREVRIIRHTKDKTQSFYINVKAVMDGLETRQFYLRPNDIIYVPEKFTWF